MYIKPEYVNKVIIPESGAWKAPVSNVNYGFNTSTQVNDLDMLAESPRVFNCQERIDDRHYIGGIRCQLKLAAWEHELKFVCDNEKKNFLLNGISQGFGIVDDDTCIPMYDCPNYKSCLESEANQYLSRLFEQELYEGKVIASTVQPHCIHSIGAIPKKDGTYRPITDCSRPINYSINNYMESTALPFKYNSLDDVCNRLSRGDFMCCTDIKAAYCSLPIRPDHWKYQGFRWGHLGQSSYYLDTRLSFGLRCAPYVFNEISNFVVDCMARRGHYNIINYLDDYFCWGSSFQKCADTQNCLIQLLGQLGFAVAWPKCSSPATKCVFLGVLIDSEEVTMSLPAGKMDRLMQELQFFRGRARATVKQIQRLGGILAYASRVIRGGRTFSRRVIDLLKNLSPSTKCVRLSTQFTCDLNWWLTWASSFNGRASMITHNYGTGLSISTDASGSGYGVIYSQRWCAGYFDSSLIPKCVKSVNPYHTHWLNLRTGTQLSINVLELLPIWLACVLWSQSWRGHQVICWTDNNQVLASINKGSSISSITMSLLRHIFWYSVKHDFHLVARRVPGIENHSPDFLSRINQSTTAESLGNHVSCCFRRARSLG